MTGVTSPAYWPTHVSRDMGLKTVQGRTLLACPFSTPGMFHPRLFRLVGFFQSSLGILSIKVTRYSSVFLLHILVTTPSPMLDPFQILHRFPKFTGVTLYPLWCPLPHQGQGLEARASHTRTTEFRREKLQSQDHLSNPHQPSAKISVRQLSMTSVQATQKSGQRKVFSRPQECHNVRMSDGCLSSALLTAY